ncbi:ornithine--oxo-acid transaminase [Streptoalloteichus tenebrarius]|uniref:ornithine aminotransferase n=1 Tax=Streptoalloteichus tenebrarius (strain ATCC 17920 / DSM 40477 / JCM 4838 / CBS 697.72 / NBRC 16177 / NCIMB 11028 / NRRL B-12390 / A12253. 1 / ISP 5477) TaxID=1933 RepID=A0ABT1HS83_STRSD|nr:ornithine--oxo-acid transaminase [Streptoalloteichus tenebrarius]MCP2258338.1 ornithine--oxo-acid transaminase [Streptoalloteichus tenebrarius]BFF03504.1 ornithine--oxo-acid transaminase [Streptoalloteichus tenebrarius]
MTVTDDRPAPGAPSTAADYVALDEQWSTHNYHPLPVVIAHAEGAWVTDVAGRRYLDFLSGYSALNFGHRHPELVAAAVEQLGRVTLTSRAFHHDQLGLFCRELAELTGTEMVLPMNSGAEAVESAIKVARKWAYRVKGVPEDAAQIVVAGSNFHGRTTTIVSFSTDSTARADFGPFTPGFTVVKYGDVQALEAAITEHTAAVLVEPIQGEAGVVVPPLGYLRAVRRVCDDNNVLLIADEIQSGLARTGDLLALDHEGVRADLYTLGKALGGGIMPVSAVVGRGDVLGVLRPGEHGSTFGGNPLACAVGRAVVRLLATGEFQERSRELGAHLHSRLGELVGDGVAEVRGRGLWAGVEIAPGGPSGRAASEALAERGVLCKETHETTLRVAPPLVITREELDRGVDAIAEVLRA